MTLVVHTHTLLVVAARTLRRQAVGTQLISQPESVTALWHQNCSMLLCTTVIHNDMHTHEQFLQFTVGLRLVFVRLFSFSIFVCMFFSGLA